MKKLLLLISLALAAPGVALAEPDTSQIMMVWGAGNKTCSQYLEAAQRGDAGSAAFDQWFHGYVTARNQLSTTVLDYAGVVDRAELLSSLSKYCLARPQSKYYEAANSIIYELERTGKVRFVKK